MGWGPVGRMCPSCKFKQMVTETGAGSGTGDCKDLSSEQLPIGLDNLGESPGLIFWHEWSFFIVSALDSKLHEGRDLFSLVTAVPLRGTL